MAITLTDPGVDTHSTTDGTTFASGSWTPPANALLVCWVITRGTQATPDSVSGHGVTYTQKATATDAAGIRMHLYVANSGASPTTGSDTADFTSSGSQTGCHVMVHAFEGVGLSGGAAAAVVQAVVTAPLATGTSGSLTLAAAGDAANRPISAWVHRATEATNPATNWTEIDDGSFATPPSGAECQWRSDAFDTAAAASWTTSSGYAGIAAEIKAAAAGGPTPIPRVGPDRRAGN